MITWSFIIDRIKEEMSLPFQMLEKTDEQLVDYLKRNALKKFTFYYPQKWRITLDCSNPDYQVDGRQSEFYLIDPDDRDILNVTDIHTTMGGALYTGHPIMGPFTGDAVPEWHLQVYNSNLIEPFSQFNYTHEFIPPNIIRISPNYNTTCTVEYERTHDPELSTLNPEIEDVFIDLCLGMVMMLIGRLRQKYSNTNTPFGEIQLNGDMIFNDGKDIFDRTIEKLERYTMPNVIFDHG